MRRFFPLLLLLFFISPAVLIAQEGDFPEYDWSDFYVSPYARGDRTLHVSMGLLMPTFVLGIEGNSHGISIGGTGTLSFNYFLGPNLFVGGEVSGSFAATRGSNMLYLIPMGGRVGYQFLINRFEFPFSLMLGLAPQSYLEKDYFGPVLKPGVAAYWRFNPDWSFGANAYWWMIPQWPRNGNNTLGTFLELSLSARYHF
ncbi:MAG: hypothetical protein FWG77_07870 [Treponema sp.]|nr:hypothetical protein [Treponema sp.]